MTLAGSVQMLSGNMVTVVTADGQWLNGTLKTREDGTVYFEPYAVPNGTEARDGVGGASREAGAES